MKHLNITGWQIPYDLYWIDAVFINKYIYRKEVMTEIIFLINPMSLSVLQGMMTTNSNI